MNLTGWPTHQCCAPATRPIPWEQNKIFVSQPVWMFCLFDSLKLRPKTSSINVILQESLYSIKGPDWFFFLGWKLKDILERLTETGNSVSNFHMEEQSHWIVNRGTTHLDVKREKDTMSFNRMRCICTSKPKLLKHAPSVSN